MYQVDPWPSVRQHEQCLRVVFHQYQVGQEVGGMPVKKPTELFANSRHVLMPFANLQCDGSHSHAQLVSGRAGPTQRWTRDMCRRIAYGIEKLVIAEASHSFPFCRFRVWRRG